MNRRAWLVSATLLAVVGAFIAGMTLYKQRTNDATAQTVDQNTDGLVRPHSPVFGDPAAKVTIVEFFDPSCETCRAFHPIVKQIVNSSFGQVRLVLRYAPLHEGSDVAVRILEAARLQGKYWEALEAALAAQPRWAAHHDPKPELIWELLGEVGIDVPKARAAAASSREVDELLRQDVADMRRLNVRQTPGFFVNGVPLAEFGERQLKALVAKQLENTK